MIADDLAAALARAEAAESECAELHDALDAMRLTADEVQARQRGRVQAGAWAQAAAAVVGAIDVEHLTRQAEFSRRTFGPGLRTRGVIDHITKEFDEILADPTVIDEWVDVIILAFDGALRTGAAPAKVIAAVKAKQAKNEARVWPDFRDFGEDEAIEHDRGVPVSVGSVSFRSGCDRDGCGGDALWTGRVADNGGGTSYRVYGCTVCGPVRPTHPATDRLWRRTA